MVLYGWEGPVDGWVVGLALDGVAVAVGALVAALGGFVVAADGAAAVAELACHGEGADVFLAGALTFGAGDRVLLVTVGDWLPPGNRTEV